MVAILHPVGPGAQIPIDRAVVLIGRSPECDVVLDVSSKISRMHCALVQVDADYFIRDLGSMNGVTVAGEKVEKDYKLTNGAEVIIGDVKFLFLENVAPAAKNTKQAPVAGRPMPALIDESARVINVDNVEVVEPRRSGMGSLSPRTPGSGTPRLPMDVDHVEVVEPEIINVGAVEIVEDIEVINDVEIVDDIVEVVDVVEVVDDIEVIEDVEIIDDEQPYRRPRRRR